MDLRTLTHEHCVRISPWTVFALDTPSVPYQRTSTALLALRWGAGVQNIVLISDDGHKASYMEGGVSQRVIPPTNIVQAMNIPYWLKRNDSESFVPTPPTKFDPRPSHW